MGILRKGYDEVVMNQGRRSAEAKKSVLNCTTAAIHRYKAQISALGRLALGALYAGINGNMWRANYATDHDVLVAKN